MSFSLCAQDRVKEFKETKDFILKGMQEMKLDSHPLYSGIYLRLISSFPQINFDEKAKQTMSYSSTKEWIKFKPSYWDALNFDARIFVTTQVLLGVIGYESESEPVKLSQKITHSDYYAQYFQGLKNKLEAKLNQPMRNLCYGTYQIGNDSLIIENHAIHETSEGADFDLAQINADGILLDERKTIVKCDIFKNYVDISYNYRSSYNSNYGIDHVYYSAKATVTLDNLGNRVLVGSVKGKYSDGRTVEFIIKGYGVGN